MLVTRVRLPAWAFVQLGVFVDVSLAACSRCSNEAARTKQHPAPHIVEGAAVANACVKSWQQRRLAWVHSSVVRAADCRSAGPWFKSGCALFGASLLLWRGACIAALEKIVVDPTIPLTAGVSRAGART